VRPILCLLGDIFRKMISWIDFCLAYSSRTPPNVSVGCHTYGFHDRTFYLPTGKERVTIGKYCSIAADVEFIFGDHALTRVSTFPLRHLLLHTPTNADAVYRGPIVVGNDVWIGRRSLILANVRIGDGAVVAAGSVVTRDVEPYTVVGGVPAQMIKRRFSDSQIDELLRIRWWDWPEERIINKIELFYNDVDAFIAIARQGFDGDISPAGS
jgi:acetyltransferase-like isoleucine patch superfamily enzyme